MRSSTTTNGANIPQAMSYLRRAEISHDQIAAALGVTLRTVKRWAVGTQRPNPRNFAALRQQIAEWRWEADRKTFTSRLERHREELLFEALTALETTEEKARVAELAARLDKPVEPQRSAYAEVDPFELCQPEPALPL